MMAEVLVLLLLLLLLTSLLALVLLRVKLELMLLASADAESKLLQYLVEPSLVVRGRISAVASACVKALTADL